MEQISPIYLISKASDLWKICHSYILYKRLKCVCLWREWTSTEGHLIWNTIYLPQRRLCFLKYVILSGGRNHIWMKFEMSKKRDVGKHTIHLKCHLFGLWSLNITFSNMEPNKSLKRHKFKRGEQKLANKMGC